MTAAAGWLGWTEATAASLLWTLGKGLVLMGAASVAALALGRRGAMARHVVWALGLGALLLLPALEWAGPSWRVEVPSLRGRVGTPAAQPAPLPRSPLHRGVGTPAAQPAPLPGRRAATPVTSPAEEALPGRIGGGVSVPPSATPPSAAPATAIVPAEAASPAPPTEALARSGAAPAWMPWSPYLHLGPLVATLFLATWAGGAVLLLSSLVASFEVVRRVERRCLPVAEGRVRDRALALAAHLGIDRPVRLLEGARHAMPMSWGLVRPRLLLPRGAEHWPAGRLDAVLLHELAHIRRRDCLTQALAEVAWALHWPNPFAWLAVTRLRAEREHACDDLVLAAGARPSDYADELLALSLELRGAPGASLAALAMARPSGLRDRLRAVLDEERPRAPLGGGTGASAAAVALGLTLLLAAFTPAARADTGAAVRLTADPSARPSVAEAPLTADPSARPSVAEAPLAAREPRTPPVVSAAPLPLQAVTCAMSDEGWRRMSHQSDDQRHRVEWSKPGCEVEVRVEGEVTFTPDFMDVERLSSDGLLRIHERDGRTDRRIEVSAGPGGRPDYAYSVDRRERAFDEDARAWFGGMLLQLFRRGGFAAEERVRAILERDGVAGVLAELDHVTAGHVFARYVELLIQQADLSEAQTVALVARARERVDSDHYLSAILEAVAERQELTPRVMDAFLEASTSMESDHYRKGVLETALRRGDLTPSQVSALLASASRMDSDHYLATLLAEVGKRHALEPATRAAYLESVRSIESDHYRTDVLSSLMSQPRLETTDLARILTLTSEIGSDHYKATMLEQAAGLDLASAELRRAYLDVAGSIDSDHYRHQSLSRLLDHGSLDDALLVDVIRSASRLGSDHYKADLLVEIAEGHGLQGDARAAFLEAMEGLGSETYRGRVASALLRSERSAR